MPQTQFWCSLCWVIGLHCIHKDANFEACGCLIVQCGAHLSKCTCLGAPARSPSFINETFAEMCRESGLQVQNEKALPQHPELIPAGLLPSGPMALDFTEWSRQPGTTDPLDRAMVLKDKRPKGPAAQKAGHTECGRWTSWWHYTRMPSPSRGMSSCSWRRPSGSLTNPTAAPMSGLQSRRQRFCALRPNWRGTPGSHGRKRARR